MIRRRDGRFKRPDDVELPLRPKRKKETADHRTKYKKSDPEKCKRKASNHNQRRHGGCNPWLELKKLESNLPK